MAGLRSPALGVRSFDMITADATERPGAAREGLLAHHPLVFFFLIAYAGAWLLEVPIALSETGTGLLPFTTPLPVLALAIAAATFLGPTLSAFIMTSITEGRMYEHYPGTPARRPF